MAYINTGQLRSLILIITKKINGNIVNGYPKTYNGQNPFTWDERVYTLLSDSDFSKLNNNDYLSRLEDFKRYVENIENGLNVDEDIDPNKQSSKPGTVDGTCQIETYLCTTSFYVARLTSSANGFITYNGVESENHLVSGSEFTNISVKGTLTNNSRFVGWSQDPVGINIISTNLSITVPLGCGTKYYLVITNDYIIERNFYYYPMNTVIEEICGRCLSSMNVFFNKQDLYNNGLDGTIWYKDRDLTTFVDSGYYKFENEIGTVIYVLNNGQVLNKIFNCEDNNITTCYN